MPKLLKFRAKSMIRIQLFHSVMNFHTIMRKSSIWPKSIWNSKKISLMPTMNSFNLIGKRWFLHLWLRQWKKGKYWVQSHCFEMWSLWSNQEGSFSIRNLWEILSMTWLIEISFDKLQRDMNTCQFDLYNSWNKYIIQSNNGNQPRILF